MLPRNPKKICKPLEMEMKLESYEQKREPVKWTILPLYMVRNFAVHTNFSFWVVQILMVPYLMRWPTVGATGAGKVLDSVPTPLPDSAADTFNLDRFILQVLVLVIALAEAVFAGALWWLLRVPRPVWPTLRFVVVAVRPLLGLNNVVTGFTVYVSVVVDILYEF